MTGDRLTFNGIDGVTGQYLTTPMDYAQIARLARGETQDQGLINRLKRVLGQLRGGLGLPLGVNPADPCQAGWAVVFHQGESQTVHDALQPLIDHRQRQVGDARCKRLEFLPGDTWRSFLRRCKTDPGSIQPTRLPYYVLLVGEPERIPFEFQYLLDVEYAVGRVCFDTPDEYRRYAESVVAYEQDRSVPHSKSAVLFGPRVESDEATRNSADLLVKPLADGARAEGAEPEQPPVAEQHGFVTRRLWGADARKEALGEALRAPAASPPAFLFAATHGLGWPKGHALQRSRQGALACQQWPGPGAIDPAQYFSAADLPGDARVHGLIAFLFACYAAGTPRQDSFPSAPSRPPTEIAERAFVAALPQRLMSHPQGGALAVIGHVDRVWSHSYYAYRAGLQLQPFRNAIGAILSGLPVGHAVRDFSERYAALSADLSGLMLDISRQMHVPDEDLARAWTERNDAQNYVILGDPAVRLRVTEMQA